MPPVETVIAENEELKARVAELEAQIAWFRRQLFAGSKSEKLDPAQLELLKGLDEQRKELEKQTVSYERTKPEKRKSRDECYANLPILEETIILPDEVKANPDLYEEINREYTYQVKIDPPKAYRHAIIRPRFRLKADRSIAPVLAPAPVRVVEGIASAQLLAYIVVSKFLDHLPLYRQCAIYKRHGFIIARQNLVRWVEKVADWLKPIYNHMLRELVEGNYLQADETPIKYCDPDYGEKKTKQGYLCGCTRPENNVVFAWRKDRTHQNVTASLKGFKGALQADAYEAYIQFALNNEGVTLIGCMAHARRKFFDAQQQHPRECKLVLILIARLYKVESVIRDQGLDAQAVCEYRQKHASNSLNRLLRLIKILRSRTLPKTGLGKACNYALNNWQYLSAYLDHGCAAIDNNGMENAIRPTAVGKKNWLFVGHPQAGDRAAILYSVLISCQRLQIDPYDYLRDVLTKDTRILSADQLTELTPKNWKNARPS